jgi:hypothetical protein
MSYPFTIQLIFHPYFPNLRIVKRFGKYGRKESLIVKRFGKYGRKVS